MKSILKNTVRLLLLVAGITALAYFFWYKPKFGTKAAKSSFETEKNEAMKIVLKRLKQNTVNMSSYAVAHDYNDEYCFIIDMKIESGKKRFFVYNFLKDSIELAGLVTHGRGKRNSSSIEFSNDENSLCTSLGKYKIGSSYIGRFGESYKLYGLDSSNNNAFARFIVLHPFSCVPNEEVYPFPICKSSGCPAVSPAFLNKLKTYIEKSRKPTLLEIFQ